ncbi:hypothetical protein T439DRAFT_357523 [Meredithblackwellia eburnea MCA 4105]
MPTNRTIRQGALPALAPKRDPNTRVSKPASRPSPTQGRSGQALPFPSEYALHSGGVFCIPLLGAPKIRHLREIIRQLDNSNPSSLANPVPPHIKPETNNSAVTDVPSEGVALPLETFQPLPHIPEEAVHPVFSSGAIPSHGENPEEPPRAQNLVALNPQPRRVSDTFYHEGLSAQDKAISASGSQYPIQPNHYINRFLSHQPQPPSSLGPAYHSLRRLRGLQATSLRKSVQY